MFIIYSDFLIISRLYRSRMSVDDFINMKVIGKGAFGEVRAVLLLD